MASEETTAPESDPQLTFKVKTSSDGNHTINMPAAALVSDLKTKLSGDDYEKIPIERQRLIYSGRVMKNEDPLSKYNIKAGNTIHMVKSAASNAAQTPAAGVTGGAPGAVPTNMAAGTANNPLAGLTGARYAGHLALPGAEMFGADGGMGAPPTEDAMLRLLEDPNYQQQMNEALQNPAMIDMMMQSVPGLRDNPQARQMLQSPEFRRMLTNPEAMRQAARLRQMMGGGGAGGGGSSFPAPGVTDTTPAGAVGNNADATNPFAAMGAGGAAGNPFAALLGNRGAGPVGATPLAPTSASQGTPSTNTANPAAANPFASLFGGGGAPGAGGAAGNPFGMQNVTPEMMQEAMQMLGNGGGAGGNIFGGMGGLGGAGSPPPPADTRPPEEQYADQLRQLNDMGFFDFDRNVQALRRSGGSVQGAIEQLLS
ncbi:hypothetical protein BJ875DRAFT_481383 [Amylocarpus encephaloides]|uniref:Deubiquitination-protection protein dph1 n=1 Tax=Amylocarpus encephaloides TaxID=45428 RepID=A0A9P8C838_9HELO|nr:hypothetical protein BJ875DRAFT_481383 [Amylocarpus encephaloides]